MLIAHTRSYFDKNVPVLKSSLRNNHKRISISHPPLRVLFASLHTMKGGIKGSFCGLQQLKLPQANKSQLPCTWFPLVRPLKYLPEEQCYTARNHPLQCCFISQLIKNKSYFWKQLCVAAPSGAQWVISAARELGSSLPNVPT